jgi:predicted DNA-binding ribbon-helix-helix protein
MLQNAMFPVKEVPATMVNEKGELNHIGNTGYKFITREDTGEILSCMTDSYRLVTNESIIKAAEPIVKKHGGKVKEVSIFSNGRSVHMKWHFPKHLVKIGKQDELTPEIVVGNSYDGTLGVNIMAGAFRLICLNGAVIGIVASRYKNKHIKSNISFDDFDEVISETMDKTKVIFKEEFPVLQGTNFKDKHVIDFLQMFPLQANEMVTQALIANSPKSFWDLFNVGTNVLSHHMNRNQQSTHNIEGRLYPTIKKWAEKEAKVAIA